MTRWWWRREEGERTLCRGGGEHVHFTFALLYDVMRYWHSNEAVEEGKHDRLGAPCSWCTWSLQIS